MAGLAFPKLFPVGQADPTASRMKKIPELKAAAHLLRYAELDPLVSPSEANPNGQLYYPFSEHERFSFWMLDRIRRHRSLQQTSVYLRNNPNDAALTMEELKLMVRNGQISQIMGRIYAYSANIVGSDGYWNKKRRELEAIMQQKSVGTLFFTLSFADNHWPDLHRLMPAGLLPGNQRYKSIIKNPHLADWYFSHKMEVFMKHFFKGNEFL